MSIDDEPIAVIQEGTAWGLQFDITDKADTPEVPSTISYKINDEATGSELASSTTVPASTFEIALNSTVNTLQNRAKTEGVHVITVTCEFASATDLLVIVTRWKVKRTKNL